MVIVSLLLAVLFTGIAIWKLRELPESFSAMVYVFQWPWLWTLWLWAVVLLLTPMMIESVGDDWQFVAFLSTASLLFCGTMPLFIKEQRMAHYIFAVVGGVLSQVCVALISPWWLLAWTLYVPLTAGIWRSTSDKSTFLAEVLCAAALYGAMLT